MKLQLETIQPDSGSSFRILLTPNLNDIFYWHFHPEIEIVYVEAEKGIRHIGDHISQYEGSDLAIIGSYIPHLNFDYGVKTSTQTVVVQLRETFFEDGLKTYPEMSGIVDLFVRARQGIAFGGKTKKKAGERLKKLESMDKFSQFFELLSIFQFLSKSDEFVMLDAHPISGALLLKQQQRIHQIYRHVEAHFLEPIDTPLMAKKVNLSVPAFCRYFKKATRLTYTDFVNQYRVNYSKKLLLQHHTVTEACYASGFENLSYFNRSFKKFSGQSPSVFRKSNS